MKQTIEKVRWTEERFDNGESVQYVNRPKSTESHAGEIAGIAGIYPKWGRRFATLGLVLDDPFWGRGYSQK